MPYRRRRRRPKRVYPYGIRRAKYPSEAPWETQSNPNQFTTDEAQTATLLVTEGYSTCAWYKRNGVYRYPKLEISMCDREALKPASNVLKTKISRDTTKTIVCPPHLFPPDGKGTWRIRKHGKRADQVVEQLKPLLTKEFLRKWEETKKRCHPST